MFYIKKKGKDVYLTKIVIDSRDNEFHYIWTNDKSEGLQFASFGLAYSFFKILSKTFIKNIDICK